MLTCVSPSPPSLLGLLHAWPEKRRTTRSSNQCDSFWESLSPNWSLKPLFYIAPNISASLYLLPRACSFTFLRLALAAGGMGPMIPNTPQVMEDFLEHSLFGTSFIEPQGSWGSNPMRNLGVGLSQGIATKPPHPYKPLSLGHSEQLHHLAWTHFWKTLSLPESYPSPLKMPSSAVHKTPLCLSLKEVRMTLPHKKCTLLLTIKLGVSHFSLGIKTE